jgi:hypothetical protein
MIDDKHTLHSRDRPDGSLDIDHYVVSALICANLRKSALFFNSAHRPTTIPRACPPGQIFGVRSRLGVRELNKSASKVASTVVTVNGLNANRNSTENEPNTFSPIYGYSRRARELHWVRTLCLCASVVHLTFTGQTPPGLNRSVAGVPPAL